MCTWVELWRTFRPDSDVLVFPETFGSRVLEYPGKKVIFNKNLYYGFSVLRGKSADQDPYNGSNLLGVMAVSEHNQRHIKFAYPHLSVCRVVEHIDETRFPFVRFDKKKPQGTYVSKSPSVLASILRTLETRARHGHSRLANFKWIEIQGKTEHQVSELLQESMIFLFPSVEEGLGRLPLEALLAGCMVLAFDVEPMTEYVPRSFVSKYMDICSLVSKIEEAVNPDCNLKALQEEIIVGRNTALTFSAAQQERTVCEAWELFLR